MKNFITIAIAFIVIFAGETRSYAGKSDLYIMFFTSKSCIHCKRMKPHWNSDQVKAEVKNYHNSMVYEIWYENDPRGFFKSYNIDSLPTTMVVDKNGKVMRKAKGYLTEKALDDFLDD